MLAPLTLAALGFANGIRHALEPDHLAAVSTILANRAAGEQSPRASVRYAAAWGAGHAAMLVVVGGALALFQHEMSETVSEALELVVAFVLVALGMRGLVQASREGRARTPAFSHTHGGVTHEHTGARDHLHVSSWTLARLPFLVGVVHGLAGSGALAALVAARSESKVFGVTFIVLYAVGAAFGMASLAGALGWPLARVARSARTARWLVATSAVVSIVVGVGWGAPIIARTLGL